MSHTQVLLQSQRVFLIASWQVKDLQAQQKWPLKIPGINGTFLIIVLLPSIKSLITSV